MRTQITDEEDANHGRFVSACRLPNHEMHLTPGWQTGFAIMMLSRFYLSTRDKQYLAAAKRGARYLASLQMLHDKRPKCRGGFREETPQSLWSHPRDAVSAAWGLTALYDATRDKDYLARAEAFGQWHLAIAFKGPWPAATINFEAGGRHDDHQALQCQSGTGAFYAALYRATKKRLYLEQGLKRTADYYAKYFFRPDGSIRIFKDERLMQRLEKEWIGGDVRTWSQMHTFNDDFGALTLMEGYNYFGRNEYLDRVEKYADWLVKRQNPNGSFGAPHEIEVGSATVPLMLMSFITYVDKPAYRTCIEKSLARLLRYQVQTGPHQGAFKGLTYHCHPGLGKWMNFRCTIYALAVLLKASGVNLGGFLETSSIHKEIKK